MVIEVTKDNYQDTISNNELVILGFLTDWDSFSMSIDDMLESIGNKLGLTVGKSYDQELRVSLSLYSVPSILIYKNGIMVEKLNGMASKSAFLEKIDRILDEKD